MSHLKEKCFTFVELVEINFLLPLFRYILNSNRTIRIEVCESMSFDFHQLSLSLLYHYLKYNKPKRINPILTFELQTQFQKSMPEAVESRNQSSNGIDKALACIGLDQIWLQKII